MGTKPAKVGRLAPGVLKYVGSAQRRPPPPRSSLRARSVGGPKLLKWGLSGRGSNLLKSDRPLTSLEPPGGIRPTTCNRQIWIYGVGYSASEIGVGVEMHRFKFTAWGKQAKNPAYPAWWFPQVAPPLSSPTVEGRVGSRVVGCGVFLQSLLPASTNFAALCWYCAPTVCELNSTATSRGQASLQPFAVRFFEQMSELQAFGVQLKPL